LIFFSWVCHSDWQKQIVADAEEPDANEPVAKGPYAGEPDIGELNAMEPDVVPKV
jgi:hypothetical protein